MADPVKHVVSVLKTALDQIQGNKNTNDVQPSPVPIPAPVLADQSSISNQQSQLIDAARRDFRYCARLESLQTAQPISFFPVYGHGWPSWPAWPPWRST